MSKNTGGRPTLHSSITAQIKARLLLARRLVSDVETAILHAYQGTQGGAQLIVEKKSDQSLVTNLDRLTERRLCESVLREFPEDTVLGEEFGAGGSSHPDSEFGWIFDPIDGTQAFACGAPLFGTMIGLTHQQVPVAGIIHMPALQETVFAMAGGGCWWQRAADRIPVRAHVSPTERLADSLFCTTSPAGFRRVGREDLFADLIATCGKFRGWGSCYGHMLVATGRADLMLDPDVKIWDCAPLIPILQEAGGAFYDLQGRPRIDGGSAISSNLKLVDEVMALVSKTSI